MPKAITALEGEAILRDNEDEKMATLTTINKDFSKNCFEMMQSELQGKQMKNI